VPFRDLPHSPAVYAQLHLVFADMDIGAFYLPAFILGAVIFFFHCLFGFVDDSCEEAGNRTPAPFAVHCMEKYQSLLWHQL
jgi:hypothetical protein